MVIDRFTERDLTAVNAFSPHGGAISTFNSHSLSFGEIFTRKINANAFNDLDSDPLLADKSDDYLDSNKRQEVDIGEIKDSSITDSEATATNDDNESRGIAGDDINTGSRLSHDNESGGQSEVVAGEHGDVQNEQPAETAGEAGELASLSDEEAVTAQRENTHAARGTSANGAAKQTEAVVNELAVGSKDQAETSRVATPEQLANIHSLRSTNQAETRAVATEEQNSNESGSTTVRASHRAAAIEQSSEGQNAHSDRQSEQQGGRPPHADESVRVTLINRGSEGYQADIREQQLGGGSTKTIQEFRQFLQREISPSIVKHARFVFHNDQESEIRILLKPAELGVMRVKIFMQNNIIHGKIVVDSALTKDIVENSLVDIQKTLRESGLHGGEIDVALHSHTQSGHDQRRFSTAIQSEERYDQSSFSEQAIENSPLFLNSALIDLYA